MQSYHPQPLQRRSLLMIGMGLCLPALPGRSAAQTTNATPPEVSSELPGASLAGSTRMRYFGLNIYDARLWILPGFRATAYAESPFALELGYLRNLSGNAIAQRSLDEMRRNGALGTEVAQRWLAAMKTAFADVKAGDRITGMHTPGQGARFWFNGKLRPAISDPEFSRLFFGIWLSERTSEPRLRAELLSGIAP